MRWNYGNYDIIYFNYFTTYNFDNIIELDIYLLILYLQITNLNCLRAVERIVTTDFEGYWEYKVNTILK